MAQSDLAELLMAERLASAMRRPHVLRPTVKTLRSSRLAVASIIAPAVLTTFPVSAAGCSQWRVPAYFSVRQNNQYNVTFVLKQEGENVWGRAGYQTSKRTVVGNVKGGISKNRCFVRVYWTLSGVSSIGVYMAEIHPSG